MNENDTMTNEEFKKIMNEIRFWADYLKKQGVTEIRFTCKEAEK